MLYEHEAKLCSSISAQAKPKKPVKARPRKSIEVNPTKPKAKKNQQSVCVNERGREGVEVAGEMLFVMENATKMKFVMKGGNGALNRSSS